MNISTESRQLLVVSELSFSYSAENEKLAIANLSLTLREGEIVAILGASGCGKSTLLNLIAGLLSPKAGKIDFVTEIDSTKHNSEQQIGYIFQDDALLPWRTVKSNLLLATEIIKELSKNTVLKLIDDYLQLFHLEKSILKQYPKQLSGGMRQRISIMQTLMFDPRILLLDEPFSALDFFTKLRLENELCQLIKEKNKGALLITHDIDEAIAIADRVLIMASNGNLTYEFKIDFGQNKPSCEEVRGTPKFAEYYHLIWDKLRTTVQQQT